MSEKLAHDATKTIKPILYQFYIALEKCFDLLENESVYIEAYGDVTIMGKAKGSQIEVKDYKKNLTDLDHNVWNTLKNWLNDSNVSNHKSLILLTTQNLSKNTLFKNWNDKNNNDRLSILNNIYKLFLAQKTQAEDTKKLLEFVLDDSRQKKLLTILEKFLILSSQENDEKLYTRLIQTRTDGVLLDKREDYINSLMGYIVNPEITSGGWEIEYNNFRVKTKSLIEEYNSKTVIFPSTYLNQKPTSDEENQYSEYTFIKKINEINYKEVKSDAIAAFIYTRKTILEELGRYEISQVHYNNYEKEIHDTYSSKYRTASRNTENSRIPKDSKNFYESVIGENAPNFRNFNDTPKRFKNGLLHQMADDDSDKNERKITWRLKVEEDE